MISSTAAANAPAARRARVARRAAAAGRGAVPASPRRAADEGERDDGEREQRRGDDAERDRVAARRRSRPRPRARTSMRENDSQVSSPASSAEAALAGEIAAGEEAGREREHRADVDPVEGLRCRRAGRPERPAQRERDEREADRDHGPGSAPRCAARGRLAAPRSRRSAMLREMQLLDRPVEDRDRHEDRRPEDDDLAVGGRVEVVRGEGEEDVGEEPAAPTPAESVPAERPKLRAWAAGRHSGGEGTPRRRRAPDPQCAITGLGVAIG